jgi:hypothetical protein
LKKNFQILKRVLYDEMAESPAPAQTPVQAPPPPPPAAPPVPLTYRERLAQFKILEEKRHELIEVRWQVSNIRGT